MTKLQAFGIKQGRLEFSDPAANAAITPSFNFDVTDLGQKRARLLMAVGALIIATNDWDHRGDDEKSAVLDGLRCAGHMLLTALAGTGDRSRLVAILSATTHLVLQSDLHLPWEFLYLGDKTGPVVLDRFFGGQAVVGRPFDKPTTELRRNRPSSRLRDLGPLAARPDELPVKIGYAEDRRLSSAQSGRERDVFRRLSIPTDDLAALKAGSASLQRLNDFLARSEILTHFNCHADAADAHKPGALYVSDAYKIDQAGIGRTDVCAQSIIVLNCCSGHTMRHDVTDTLATTFMLKNVAAVVATTASIEDRYATRWARHFYEALWSGERVPESILLARAAMLREPSPNPSAMLYAYLGRDGARVAGCRS